MISLEILHINIVCVIIAIIIRRRRKKRENLDFFAEVPFIPFLHVPMDLLFPLFSRELSNFKSLLPYIWNVLY